MSKLSVIDIPQMLFWLSIFSSSLIALLATIGSISPTFDFYPPPRKEGWQHPTFMWLFRGFFYPLIGLSIFSFQPDRTMWDIIGIAIGLPLLITGLGLAFWITFQMGWQNAFGEKKGLISTGWFHWSRNPVYVFTWIGLIGWSLTVRDDQVTILLVIWGLFYLFAPFLEEPWLEKMYGKPYVEYRAKTPRFWGFPF